MQIHIFLHQARISAYIFYLFSQNVYDLWHLSPKEKALRLEINQMSDEIAHVSSSAVSADSELQEKRDKIRLLEFEQVS